MTPRTNPVRDAANRGSRQNQATQPPTLEPAGSRVGKIAPLDEADHTSTGDEAGAVLLPATAPATDWNTPIDQLERDRLTLRDLIRHDVAAAKARAVRWEPAPMPPPQKEAT